MRNIGYEREHHATASLFGGEILSAGSLVPTAEAAPDVRFPSNCCHRRKRSLFLAPVRRDDTEKFILAIAAAYRVVEKREVLSSSLGCDLARLFDARYRNRQK